MRHDFTLMLAELMPCVTGILYMYKYVCVCVCIYTLNLCVGIVLDYTIGCDTYELFDGNLLISYVALLNRIHDCDLSE